MSSLLGFRPDMWDYAALGALMALVITGLIIAVWILGLPRMDRKLDSRLPADFREEWSLRNPPIPRWSVFGRASEGTLGPVHFGSVRRIGRARLYPCEFISRHWLANSYCSHHPRSPRTYSSGSGPVIVVQHAT
jgi:hypothetical protein